MPLFPMGVMDAVLPIFHLLNRVPNATKFLLDPKIILLQDALHRPPLEVDEAVAILVSLALDVVILTTKLIVAMRQMKMLTNIRHLLHYKLVRLWMKHGIPMQQLTIT